MPFIEYVHACPGFDDILFGLAKAVGFTPDELIANRMGKLHSNQSKTLLRKGFLKPVLLFLAGVATSVVVRFGWAVIVEQRTAWRYFNILLGPLSTGHFQDLRDLYLQGTNGDLGWAVRAALIVPPLLGLFQLRSLPLGTLSDVMSGKVLAEVGPVDGKIEEKKAGGRGNEGEVERHYFYSINKKKFPVSSAAHDALIPGIAYRVYFTAKTNKLLSIEPVRD